MPKVLFFLFLLSSILISKIEIDVIENDRSIEIQINNLNELGGGVSSVYEHLPLNEGEANTLALPLALNKNDILNYQISENFDLLIEDHGSLLGINKTMLRLIPRSNNIPTNATVQLDLSKEYPRSEVIEIPNKLLKIINRQQLSYQLDNRNHKVRNTLMSSEFSSWMKPNVDYLKIGTDKDGVCEIKGSQIIAYIGQNNPVSSIHFAHKGEDYNEFYIRSDDEIFSEDDKIYLLSKMQRGDSTYYDHFTNTSYFYLYIDQTKQNQQLKLLDNSLPENFDNIVIQYQRIEEDNQYSFGAAPWEVGATNYEGWFIDIFAPLNENFEEHSKIFDVLVPNEGNVKINAEYQHLYFLVFNNSEHENKYELDFLLNDEIVHSTGEYDINAFSEIDDFYKDSFEYSSVDHRVINGPNKFGIRSNFINSDETSRIGINNYNIRTAGIPIAKNGSAIIENFPDQFSYTDLYNLNSSLVVAIDSINRTIQFPETEKADVIAGGITENFVGLKINEDSYHYEMNEDDTKNIFYLTFDGSNIDSGSAENLSQLQDKLSSADISAIALDRDVNSSILNYFDNQFSTDLIEGQRNIILIDANSTAKHFSGEEIATGNYLSKAENSFKNLAKIKLNENRSYIFASDSQNFVAPKIEGLRNRKEIFENTEPARIIAIYHNEFEEYVNAWKDYREAQGFEIKIVNVEHIYDEFGYGRVEPKYIKNFLSYAYNNWGNKELEYVYLIGDGTWDPKYNLENSVSVNQIPVYGRPYSDMWYAMLDTNSENRFDIVVTRLSARKNEEAMNYLEKVREFESLNKKSWFKDFLLLIGGNEFEQSSLKDWSDEMFDDIIESELRIDTTEIRKDNSDAIDISKGSLITSKINEGTIWTNFFGHGAFDAVDIEGWDSAKLNNNGRTGVLSTVSCNNGAFAEPSKHRSRNEDQLLVPEKGFVGVYGGTASGSVAASSLVMERLMLFVTDKRFRLRRLSDILYLSLDDFQPGSFYDRFTLTFNYIGDPLIDLPISKNEDFLFLEESLNIKADDGSEIIDVANEFTEIKLKAFNAGYHISNPKIFAIHKYDDNLDTIPIDNFEDLSDHLIDIQLNTKDKPGNHTLDFTIDPDKASEDDDFSNNFFSFSFEVFDKNLIQFDPLNNWNLSEQQIARFFNPFFNENIEVEAEILNESGELIYTNDEINKNIQKNIIDIDLSNLEFENNKNYNIRYRSKFTNDWSSYSNLVFNTFQSERKTVKYNLIENSYKNNYKKLELNQNKIIFDTTYRSYLIESYNGQQTPHIGAQFFIDDQLILEEYGAGYYVGTINKFDPEALPKLRYFNTNGWHYPPDRPAFYEDSVNFKIIDYLRDTLSSDEYVFLAASGWASRLYDIYCNENGPCSKDTMAAVVQSLGSNLYTAEDINIDLGFAFIGGKDIDQKFINEHKTSDGTLAFIDGEAPIFNLIGKINTELIGPSKNWKKITLDCSGEMTTDVLIYNINNELLDSLTFENELTLGSYDENYLRFEFIFTRKSEKNYVEINNISIEFEPISELVVEVDNKNPGILRGDLFQINSTINNYSLRSSSDSVRILSKLNEDDTETFDIIEKINADEELAISKELSTNSALQNNVVTLSIDPDHKDYFSFNNSGRTNFFLVEDTISPELKITVDGLVAEDGDFISKNSEIAVEFYDNSRLPIENFRNFSIMRFNGFLNEDSLEFQNNFDHDATGGLKARIILPKERIKEGENKGNFVHFEASDAASNTDSIFIYLNVARNGEILEVLNFPNPFTDNTKFQFDLKAPEISDNTKAVIQIYDTYGNEIRNLESEVRIGNNEISWDGKDSFGNSIPSGRYYYLIFIKSDIYFPEDTSGISIKIK